MEYEQWLDILTSINADNNLNESNVIEKIKEKLEKEDPGTYKEWQDNQCGVNYTLLDSQLTLLHIVATNGLAKVTELLIKEGADVNKVNRCEVAPLRLAAENGHAGVINILVRQGAEVNVRDMRWKVPLHWAAENGHTEAANALIDGGADVEAEDMTEGRRTPLHWAAENGHTGVVNALIDRGADIEAKNRQQQTPLHLADQNHMIDVVILIVNHIATLEAADLYVGGENLRKTGEFVHTSNERHDNYLQRFHSCKEEAEKIKKGNKLLYDFLRESNINKLVSIWEASRNMSSKFNDERDTGIKKQYPKYKHILTNKANKVKREIFLYNHKPLIDVLPQLGYHGGGTPDEIKAFLEKNRDEFKVKLGVREKSLIDFVDFEDVAVRHTPELELCSAISVVIRNNAPSGNLGNPSTEQLRAVGRQSCFFSFGSG